MSDFVGVDVSGIPEVQKMLASLPPAVQDAVVEDTADYLLNVLRTNPPEKRVTRKEAYGVTFFSDKQRRFFFAALADGRINVPYQRTQGQSKGWRKIGNGKNAMVVNETPGVIFTRDDERQSRLSKLIGWKTVSEEIRDRADRIKQIIEGAAKRAIKKVGR
jgi:hypothetical protein